MEEATIFYLKKFLKILLIYVFRESDREGEREGDKHQCVRETLISHLSHVLQPEIGLQPRRVA